MEERRAAPVASTSGRVEGGSDDNAEGDDKNRGKSKSSFSTLGEKFVKDYYTCLSSNLEELVYFYHVSLAKQYLVLYAKH